MARAPGDVANWDGSGQVWFKVNDLQVETAIFRLSHNLLGAMQVHQITANANGQTITFPAENIQEFSFQLPRSLPSGQYLVRTEQIALHSASGFQGAQFYVRHKSYVS